MAFDRTIIIGRLLEHPTAFGAKANRKSRSGVRFRIWRSTFEDGQETRHCHDIAAFGKLAATVYDHLDAGDLCLVEGRLARRGLTHGPAVGYPPIMADNVVFLSKRREA